MFDFHVHVGEGFLPAEAMRYAHAAGYRGVGLLVRVDGATLPLLLPWLLQTVRHYSLYAGVEAFAGVELVHIPPALMPETVAEARSLGANLILAHGETLTDTVPRGTNLAAIEAGVDILAHPGLITPQDAELAAAKGTFLELTTAPGHGLANAHVAAMAMEYGCGLVLGGNVRQRGDFACAELREAVLTGACLPHEGRGQLDACMRALASRLMAM